MAEFCSKCQNKEFVEVKHEFSFCKGCASLYFKNSHALRPFHPDLKLDPLTLIQNIHKSRNSFKCSGELKYNIPKLKKWVKQNKFSETVLYLSLDYAERVINLSIIPENKKELVTLACFILAGRNYLK